MRSSTTLPVLLSFISFSTFSLSQLADPYAPPPGIDGWQRRRLISPSSHLGAGSAPSSDPAEATPPLLPTLYDEETGHVFAWDGEGMWDITGLVSVDAARPVHDPVFRHCFVCRDEVRSGTEHGLSLACSFFRDRYRRVLCDANPGDPVCQCPALGAPPSTMSQRCRQLLKESCEHLATDPNLTAHAVRRAVNPAGSVSRTDAFHRDTEGVLQHPELLAAVCMACVETGTFSSILCASALRVFKEDVCVLGDEHPVCPHRLDCPVGAGGRQGFIATQGCVESVLESCARRSESLHLHPGHADAQPTMERRRFREAGLHPWPEPASELLDAPFDPSLVREDL